MERTLKVNARGTTDIKADVGESTLEACLAEGPKVEEQLEEHAVQWTLIDTGSQMQAVEPPTNLVDASVAPETRPQAFASGKVAIGTASHHI